jgi:hypothetical protein
MKINELKAKAYDRWVTINEFKQCLIQPKNFKVEVRKRFGDMRRKDTWIKACSHFWAQVLDACWDIQNTELITLFFNFKETDPEYEIRHEIFEAFMQFPDSLERIRNGLERLLGEPINEKEERAINGFFKLAQESTCIEFNRIPVGFIQRSN